MHAQLKTNVIMTDIHKQYRLTSMEDPTDIFNDLG